MSHYYYVIYFDEETKEWIHDCDVESNRFDDGTIWNTETEEWESGYLGDNTWKPEAEKVDELMNEGLTFLNRISAVKHLVEGK